MRMVDCLSHCGTMDKTEQECGNDVLGKEVATLDAVVVKNQSEIIEEAAKISSKSIESENGISRVEASCNGVETDEKLLNGDLEKAEVDKVEGENSELEKNAVDKEVTEKLNGEIEEVTPCIEQESNSDGNEIKESENIIIGESVNVVTKDEHVVNDKNVVDDKTVVAVNGTQENENSECEGSENPVKEPDKSESTKDNKELDGISIESSNEENIAVDKEPVVEEKVSSNEENIAVDKEPVIEENVSSNEENIVVDKEPVVEEKVEIPVEVLGSELKSEPQVILIENSNSLQMEHSETKTVENSVSVENSESISEEVAMSENETDILEKQTDEVKELSNEVNESSISSGPPSLVKEVASDDNSITSDQLGTNEEAMEVDKKPSIEETILEPSYVSAEADTKPENISDCKSDVEKVENEPKCVDLNRETVEKFEPSLKEEEPAVKEKVESAIESDNKSEDKTGEMSEVSPTSPLKNLSKGQKLDQLLSKITTKAETSNQKLNPPPQKHAKARKSCANSSSNHGNPVQKPSAPPSITTLTFNVKELEKKGVLDIPKPSKRKAFEPIKIPSPDKDKSGLKKSSPIRSPVRSPIRSPSKAENPFFKKKLIRRKKKRFRNTYKLPGEKNWKKTKTKKSEERQLCSDRPDDIIVQNAESGANYMPASLPVPHKVSHTVTIGSLSPGQKNALDMLTMNSRKSFPSTSGGSSMKKARKTVRQTIDPATHRTLDSFLKSKSGSQPQKDSLADSRTASDRSVDLPHTEHRKRKANDQAQAEHSTSLSPEEKKRKMEILQPPQQQQMITLLPTGSPPLGMPTATHPIMPAPGTGSQILLSPGSAGGQQTIIQNGTLNGLPVFQLFSNQSIASTQPAQFVAIAQSQGRQLLTSSASINTTPIQPQGVPLLFAPITLSASNISQPQLIASKPGIGNTVTSTILGNQTFSVPPVSQSTIQQQHTVLKNSLNNPRMQLPNRQYVDLKHLHKDVPNGMYPVTPPKTPEEQRSETGSQDTVEEMEAALGSVMPDKDVIPLCTCKISGASFQKMATVVTFCQALDSVDGKVLGCCNKVTNPQLVRPAVKIPFLALCDSHRKRLRLHQCCPGCGYFCTQGKFLQCKKEGSSFIHHFHEQCQVTKDGKHYCPHCGETSNQYEVHLSMLETKQTVTKDTKPTHRTQLKARIGVVDKKTSGGEDSSDEAVVSHTVEKSKKVLSTADMPAGPDRYSLERVLSSLAQERPKKYRHLPKCLYTPAYDNDLERVVYMLEDGHDPNELYDDLEGQSALHAAAAVGSLPIVHVLIQAGASPHHQDISLKTPLMFASENNHPDVVKYLIRANTTVDAKASDGMSALHLAAKAGHVNIINILLDTERINIDITDDGGWTPLIWAAEHMEVEAVRLLLKRKSDPNLRDSEENTTMHWAAFSGSVAIAELLLAAGCDLDSLNMHGDRPLHIAARQDHYECVVLFLARGADVEAKNNKGESPLECCIEQNTAVYLALKVNKQLKSFGAKHMGKPEKLIHRDLSKGRENIPIPCVNGVDDEGEPRDYLYVVDNIETTCLNINRVIGSLQSCQCKDDCSSIYCACGKNSVRCWYDKYNRLVPEFNMLEPPLIFECNRACECWTTCNNRVVQNGVMSRLQVFKTSGRGWGCKTLVDIPRGTFICEYIGEHISDSEADRREDDSYLFDLDNKDGETYCIDARRYGNVARFINHLCEPNLTPVKVFVDNQDLRFPRICLFANRDIKAQEELGFDYGEKFWIIKWKQFTCTCGSAKCRYSTDTIQKTLEEYRLRHEIDGEEMQD